MQKSLRARANLTIKPAADAARQRAPIAPAMAPPPVRPDFSGSKASAQITARSKRWSRPTYRAVDRAFRSELNEIRHAITEAMPRRAIESIENEIRSLSRRIDDSRRVE